MKRFISFVLTFLFIGTVICTKEMTDVTDLRRFFHSPKELFQIKRRQMELSPKPNYAESLKLAKNELVQFYEFLNSFINVARNDSELMMGLFADKLGYYAKFFNIQTPQRKGFQKTLEDLQKEVDIYKELLVSKVLCVDIVKKIQQALQSPKRDMTFIYKQIYALARISRFDFLHSIGGLKVFRPFINAELDGIVSAITFVHNHVEYQRLPESLKPLVRLLSVDQIELLSFEDIQDLKAYIDNLDSSSESATRLSLLRLEEFVFYVRALLHLAPLNFPNNYNESLSIIRHLSQEAGLNLSMIDLMGQNTPVFLHLKTPNEFQSVNYERDKVFGILEANYFSSWGLLLSSEDESFMKMQVKRLNNPKVSKPKKKKSKTTNQTEIVAQDEIKGKGDEIKGDEIKVDEIGDIKVKDEEIIEIIKQEKEKSDIFEIKGIHKDIKERNVKKPYVPYLKISKKEVKKKEFPIVSVLEPILKPKGELSFKDFKQIMTDAGFVTVTGAGSGYKFYFEKNGEKIPLIVHRPHNSKFVKGVLRDIARELTLVLDMIRSKNIFL
jgi:hypothetical protein